MKNIAGIFLVIVAAALFTSCEPREDKVKPEGAVTVAMLEQYVTVTPEIRDGKRSNYIICKSEGLTGCLTRFEHPFGTAYVGSNGVIQLPVTGDWTITAVALNADGTMVSKDYTVNVEAAYNVDPVWTMLFGETGVKTWTWDTDEAVKYNPFGPGMSPDVDPGDAEGRGRLNGFYGGCAFGRDTTPNSGRGGPVYGKDASFNVNAIGEADGNGFAADGTPCTFTLSLLGSKFVKNKHTGVKEEGTFTLDMTPLMTENDQFIGAVGDEKPWALGTFATRDVTIPNIGGNSLGTIAYKGGVHTLHILRMSNTQLVLACQVAGTFGNTGGAADPPNGRIWYFKAVE